MENQIKHLDLTKVPNEVIIAVYNTICSYDEMIGTMEFGAPFIVEPFGEVITPYTTELIEAKKMDIKKAINKKLNNFIQSSKGGVDEDELHFVERDLHFDECAELKKLEKIIKTSNEFYKKLNELYEEGLIDKMLEGNPFEIKKEDGTAKFIVGKGYVIHFNYTISGTKPDFIYTAYEDKGVCDYILEEMQENTKNLIQKYKEIPQENE